MRACTPTQGLLLDWSVTYRGDRAQELGGAVPRACEPMAGQPPAPHTPEQQRGGGAVNREVGEASRL